MSEITYERIKENLLALNMKNTLEIIDNYLERAIADKVNIVYVLDHIFSTEAKAKKGRAAENQIQMSGFPFKKTLRCLISLLSQALISLRLTNYAP